MLGFSEFNKEKKNENMKRFSDGKKVQGEDKGKAPSGLTYEDELNSNILAKRKPLNIDKSKFYEEEEDKNEKPLIDDNIQSNDNSKYNDKKHKPSSGIANFSEEGDSKNENRNTKVKIKGRVAKFPKGVKASKAYNFINEMDNIKIPKNKIWYLMVEKQDNELQMVKYQTKKGVNLAEFINELKKFYINKFTNDVEIQEKIKAIEIGGDKDGNISYMRNIPNINMGEDKLIKVIVNDLTKLLNGKV